MRYLFVLVRQAVSSSHEFHMLYQIRSFHMLFDPDRITLGELCANSPVDQFFTDEFIPKY